MSPTVEKNIEMEPQNDQSVLTTEMRFDEKEEPYDNGNADVEISNNTEDRGTNDADRAELIKKAQSILAEGRRFLVCRDYQNAVDSLNEACSLFPQLYGELAAECAEVYLLYGKSLVELERANQTIFGDKNEKTSEGDESEDEEEVCDQQTAVIEATECVETNGCKEDKLSKSEENIDFTVESNENSLQNGNQIPKSVEVKDDVSNDNENHEQAGCSTAIGSEKTTADAADEEVCGGNTAEAWETLDVARVIYEKFLTETKNLDEETKKKEMFRLSEVRMTLGEVCALDEKYFEAIQEFTAAHEILKDICAEDDRRLAEIYFQIGTASELNFDFVMATENIKKAAKVLENRKHNFEKRLEILTANDADSSSKKEDLESEIKDLNDVLVDIQQRLLDLSESQKNSEAVKQNLVELVSKQCAVVENASIATVEKTNGHAVPAATDVSHLIRRPLKRVSDGSNPENEAKRPKLLGDGDQKILGSEDSAKCENQEDQVKTNDDDQAPMDAPSVA